MPIKNWNISENYTNVLNIRLDLKQQEQSPTYQIKQAQEQALELVQIENSKQFNEIEHDKWIESERQIEREWTLKRKKIEEQAKKKEAERQRIQEEFKAEQQRIEHEAEEKLRLLEQEKQRQIELENHITAYIDGLCEIPSELLEVAETNPGKELCPFFSKVATCRFGNKCLRNHRRQKIGRILGFPAFFTNIRLEQNKATEYGNDLSLEYGEKELLRHFKVFFSDIVPGICSLLIMAMEKNFKLINTKFSLMARIRKIWLCEAHCSVQQLWTTSSRACLCWVYFGKVNK